MTEPVPFVYDVHTDVFPAVLVVSPPDAPVASIYTAESTVKAAGGNKLEKVRVLVSSSHVIVFGEGSGNGPEIIYSQPLASPQSFSAAKRLSHRINDATRSMHPESTGMTADGTTFAFHRMSGCGCGSRLKAFNPFRTLSTLAATTKAS